MLIKYFKNLTYFISDQANGEPNDQDARALQNANTDE